jgi:hypothetical protein
MSFRTAMGVESCLLLPSKLHDVTVPRGTVPELHSEG